MLILTNCLSEVADEGCLNVVNRIVTNLKLRYDNITVCSYERKSAHTDMVLQLNKAFLSKDLFRLIRSRNEPVLFMPFPAKSRSVAARLLVLSFFCRQPLHAFLVMNDPLTFFEKLLFRLSGANFIVLSEESRKDFSSAVGERRVIYLRTGVDTKKFRPVSNDDAKALKIKYGFDPEKPVVLHVGHMFRGRNIETLRKIDHKYQVLLVTSTLTQNEQDTGLRKELLNEDNIRILSEYIPDIQEIYQLADVYFFPVLDKGHCIDVPLSCLEAAACGKNVVTTHYGEMNTFVGKPGFYHMESLNSSEINELLDKATGNSSSDVRSSVLAYDWNNAMDYFDKILERNP